MLSKKQRLTKKEFDNIFAIGKRYHCPTLQLIYNPDDVFHGAVVVGKKVYKKAVDRNRLRRQIYNIVYRFHKKTPLQGTFIFIAKPTLKQKSQTNLATDIEKLLQQTLEM
jgi:ribonuclease P protein component